MNRRNTILCALLALQLVLVLIFYWPGEAERSSRITLIDVEPEKVASLVISDDYGSSIILRKAGDHWVADPPENYPVDAERVKSVLRKVSHLESTRLVSSSRGSHGRLRVSDEKFNRLLKLVDTEGNEHVIYLGTTQGRGVYARSGRSDDVVFIDNLSSWEFATSPRSWWKSSVVDLAPDALNQVEITNGNGTFKILRNSRDMWTDSAGKVLDQDRVKRLLRAVKDIRVAEYLPKNTDKKFEKSDAVIRLVPAEGSEITIEIGREEKSERLARVSTEQHLFMVRSSNVKQLLDARVDELKAHEEKVQEKEPVEQKPDQDGNGQEEARQHEKSE